MEKNQRNDKDVPRTNDDRPSDDQTSREIERRRDKARSLRDKNRSRSMK